MACAHPTREHLAAYAGGSLSEGMNLLVASHLTYCPDCRRLVDRFEALAGGIFDSVETAGLSVPDLGAVMARLDAPVPKTSVAPDPGTPIPMPIRRILNAPVDDLDWKFRMPGLHECELGGFDGEQVSLLRARPGVRVLGHTHDGDEATLILSGQMEDGGRIYARGDVAIADHSDDHTPRIVGDEVCYCLIVLSGRMRFTGPMGRALNLFSR